MSEIAIKVENVSKRFTRSLKRTMLYGTTDLASSFFGLRQNTEMLRKGEFWALDDINFEVKKGEAIGLVGGNGAGKSTMLKLINGIFMPDRGRITINGRMGALIEVGAGFHPMLTGRENIYVNGAILGLNKSEIDKLLESIIDFAEIGEFIDSPVKNYSSGMYVRLGYAIAAHCRPEILLIDEVLAVGDARFQRKCLNHLAELRKEGVTFILVSHNMQTIEGITSRGILFEKGKMVDTGKAGKIISGYELKMLSSLKYEEPNRRDLSETGVLKLVKKYDDYGTDEVEVKMVRLLDGSGSPRTKFDSGEPLILEAVLKVFKPISKVRLWLSFINDQNVVCLGTRKELNLAEGQQVIRLRFNQVQLTTGQYKVAYHLFDESFTVPFSHGHYGYFEVIKEVPVLNPGLNTPYCWAEPNIQVEVN